VQDSGDGAGVMTAVPWELLGVAEKDRPHTGVGMLFLPQDPARWARTAPRHTHGAGLGWRAG
jgi:glutamate synthase (ferredoxin)